ncbi:MAG: hypothetical protein ACREQ5_25910, partial [Candidatus Dormibacteria bacterium]
MSTVRRFVVLASVGALLGAVGIAEPDVVWANYGSSVCPGGAAPWTGTQVAPGAPVVISSEQQLTCPPPQATLHGGSTTHRVAWSRGVQNGQPCSQREESYVSIGPVTPGTFGGSTVNGVAAPGHRAATWYDPSATPSGTTTEEIPDGPAAFNPGVQVVAKDNLWTASASMGSAEMYVTYRLEGTYAGGTCAGTWQLVDPPLCNSVGCYPHTNLVQRAPLPFTPPPGAAVQHLLALAKARFQQLYSGGQVASVPSDPKALVVFSSSCFTEAGARVPSAVGFSMRNPQAGDGPVLVVNYVVQATTDEVWWDFAEPENPTTQQSGVDPSQPCAVQHTYQHVSADAYGSNHLHHPPRRVAWTFGDAEPSCDMEAVEVWQHVHFGVTAYYTQTDGSQHAVPLPVDAGNDAWIAGTPEW